MFLFRAVDPHGVFHRVDAAPEVVHQVLQFDRAVVQFLAVTFQSLRSLFVGYSEEFGVLVQLVDLEGEALAVIVEFALSKILLEEIGESPGLLNKLKSYSGLQPQIQYFFTQVLHLLIQPFQFLLGVLAGGAGQGPIQLREPVAGFIMKGCSGCIHHFVLLMGHLHEGVGEPGFVHIPFF